mmetsp:Transcript_71542/g.202108  ORF Transcript_71542/g.202108 Transcript_71542/m.202108 type:complete len:179 (-) Transcript_71542:629-1165(-)
MKSHMILARKAGIGVLVLSWYPPDSADENGIPTDPLVPALLDAALLEGIKICLHIEPYKNRSARSVASNLEYAIAAYASHPAYHRMPRAGATKPLPVFYVYDSYHTSAAEWGHLLKEGGSFSVRGGANDAYMVFLLVEKQHQQYATAGFDGFYTYFASDGFTYGSTTRYWGQLAELAR